MPNEVKYNICKLFADYCKLYGARLLDGKMQSDLERLEEWSDKWQLPFNIVKCKVMHFGKQNLKQCYILNGRTLEINSQEKDLGIIVDNELKFQVHTDYVGKITLAKSLQTIGIHFQWKSPALHRLMLSKINWTNIGRTINSTSQILAKNKGMNESTSTGSAFFS